MNDLTQQFNEFLGTKKLDGGSIEEVLYSFAKVNLYHSGALVRLTESQWVELEQDKDFGNAALIYANGEVPYRGFVFKNPKVD